VVEVVGARRSCSGRGRRGRGRRGQSSAELLGTWSTWSVVDVVGDLPCLHEDYGVA